MSEISDLSSILNESLLLTQVSKNNSSEDKFQNILSILTDSEENNLATAKTFIEKMKANGMSNATAVRTYAALQKYSLMSSFGKYNFVNAKA